MSCRGRLLSRAGSCQRWTWTRFKSPTSSSKYSAEYPAAATVAVDLLACLFVYSLFFLLTQRCAPRAEFSNGAEVITVVLPLPSHPRPVCCLCRGCWRPAERASPFGCSAHLFFFSCPLLRSAAAFPANFLHGTTQDNKILKERYLVKFEFHCYKARLADFKGGSNSNLANTEYNSWFFFCFADLLKLLRASYCFLRAAN